MKFHLIGTKANGKPVDMIAEGPSRSAVMGKALTAGVNVESCEPVPDNLPTEEQYMNPNMNVCHDCFKPVSKSAKACPHCGRPTKSANARAASVMARVALWTVGGFIILSLLLYLDHLWRVG